MNTQQLIISGAKKTTAAKTTVRKASATKVKAAPSTGIRFAISQGIRASAGAHLIAHTQAFLHASGLAEGSAFPKAQATKVIGARAIQYHSANGNFTHTDKGLELTDKGALFFGAMRNVDPELQKAYEAFFKDGKCNDAINVKNEVFIEKL